MKIAIAILLVFGISWGVNIYKLTKCDFDKGYSCEILHGVGIIPIISPVMVWFGTDED